MLAVLLIMLFAGCTPVEETSDPVDPPPSPDPVDEEDPVREPVEIVVGLYADVRGLTPLGTSSIPSMHAYDLMHYGLVQWDDQLNVELLVAREMEVPDATTMIFHLHEGVLFHDGVEMTSEDVKFTFDLLRDADFGHADRAFYSSVEEITTPDPYTVIFHLSEPDAPLIYYLHVGITPKHVFEEHGLDYLEQNPVGNGPYKFVEWRPDERVVIEAFDDCFWGRPQIDRIVFRPIPEHTARVLELETEGIHAMDYHLPAEQVSRLQDNPNINVEVKPGAGYTFWGHHHEVEPFDDVRVRRAMAYAVDQDLIINHVLQGFADKLCTPIIPSSWAYNPNVECYSYDLDKAASLLEEAGLGDGFDTSVMFIVNETWREMAEMIQYSLSQLNVNLAIQEVDRGVFRQRLEESDFESYIVAWGGQTDPDRGVYRQMHSTLAPVPNFSHYSNPDVVDPLLEEARRVHDVEQRRELYWRIQEIAADDVLYVYLGSENTLTAHNARIKDFSYCGYFYTRPLANARWE